MHEDGCTNARAEGYVRICVAFAILDPFYAALGALQIVTAVPFIK